MLTPHSIIHGDACFAYFNKIWGTPGKSLGCVVRGQPVRGDETCSDRWMCRAGTHRTPTELKHPTQYASQPACASGQASKFSAECVLQHLLVEAEISDHLTQLRVPILKLL